MRRNSTAKQLVPTRKGILQSRIFVGTKAWGENIAEYLQPSRRRAVQVSHAEVVNIQDSRPNMGCA